MKMGNEIQPEADPRFKYLQMFGLAVDYCEPKHEAPYWLISGVGGESGAETASEAMQIAWDMAGEITLLHVAARQAGIDPYDEQLHNEGAAQMRSKSWASLSLDEQIETVKRLWPECFNDSRQHGAGLAPVK